MMALGSLVLSLCVKPVGQFLFLLMPSLYFQCESLWNYHHHHHHSSIRFIILQSLPMMKTLHPKMSLPIHHNLITMMKHLQHSDQVIVFLNGLILTPIFFLRLLNANEILFRQQILFVVATELLELVISLKFLKDHHSHAMATVKLVTGLRMIGNFIYFPIALSYPTQHTAALILSDPSQSDEPHLSSCIFMTRCIQRGTFFNFFVIKKKRNYCSINFFFVLLTFSLVFSLVASLLFFALRAPPCMHSYYLVVENFLFFFSCAPFSFAYTLPILQQACRPYFILSYFNHYQNLKKKKMKNKSPVIDAICYIFQSCRPKKYVLFPSVYI
mmetsp:Transcript_1133/g.1655  ORF Transcript_1133/g.1655 Transcript_1133/m.1655 type:complete len:328 (-) Transcript_1133:2794-3777(-)